MENRNKFNWPTFKKAPWWAWIFFVLCLLLPIVTLGGAIPAALAVLGILFCFRIATARKHRAVVDFALCFAITLAVWVIAFCFVFLIKML